MKTDIAPGDVLWQTAAYTTMSDNPNLSPDRSE
jgi:hypothetical protein